MAIIALCPVELNCSTITSNQWQVNPREPKEHIITMIQCQTQNSSWMLHWASVIVSFFTSVHLTATTRRILFPELTGLYQENYSGLKKIRPVGATALAHKESILLIKTNRICPFTIVPYFYKVHCFCKVMQNATSRSTIIVQCISLAVVFSVQAVKQSIENHCSFSLKHFSLYSGS